MSAVTWPPAIWRRAAQWAYAGLVLVVFVLAVAPVEETAISTSDKLNHFAAFYVLALYGALAFPRFSLWKLAVALAAYGGAIELIQGLPFVGRDCDVLDWATDCAAALCAILPLTLSRFASARRGR